MLCYYQPWPPLRLLSFAACHASRRRCRRRSDADAASDEIALRRVATLRYAAVTLIADAA